MCFHDACTYLLQRKGYLCESNSSSKRVTVIGYKHEIASTDFYNYSQNHRAVTLYSLTMHEKKKNEKMVLRFDKLLDVTEIT